MCTGRGMTSTGDVRSFQGRDHCLRFTPLRRAVAPPSPAARRPLPSCVGVPTMMRSLAVIVAALATLCAGFAVAAGWLPTSWPTQGRLRPATIVDALEAHDGRHSRFRVRGAANTRFVPA